MELPFTELSPLIQVLAQALSSLLDKPFAIFGHSLGALVGLNSRASSAGAMMQILFVCLSPLAVRLRALVRAQSCILCRQMNF